MTSQPTAAAAAATWQGEPPQCAVILCGNYLVVFQLCAMTFRHRCSYAFVKITVSIFNAQTQLPTRSRHNIWLDTPLKFLCIPSQQSWHVRVFVVATNHANTRTLGWLQPDNCRTPEVMWHSGNRRHVAPRSNRPASVAPGMYYITLSQPRPPPCSGEQSTQCYSLDMLGEEQIALKMKLYI